MATLTLSPSTTFSSSRDYFHLNPSQRRHFTLAVKSATQLPLSSTTTSSPSSNPATPTPTRRPTSPVVVLGAGLAGLSAAINLSSSGTPFIVLESSNAPGGRVRTDTVDGFILDRGFQIFITAYPEARKLLDYPSLKLQTFYSGARVFFDGRFHTVADPTRHPLDSIGTLGNPIGSFFDKIRIGLNRIRVLSRSDEEILTSPGEIPTIQFLRSFGFSNSIIDRFFRPFFGGVFFDRELETTSRLFDFIFKCLAAGENTIPADGIQAIPNQLAAKLPPNSIRFNSRVVSIDFDNPTRETDQNSYAAPISLTLEGGEVMKCESGLIVAVDQPEAERLLAGKLGKPGDDAVKRRKPARSTVCLYFSADRSQIPQNDNKPILYLNGSGRGIINNMFFATNVAPSYGPQGKALISVSLVGMYEDQSDEALADLVKVELSEWFGGSVVAPWRLLRVYRIGFAQPNQSPPTDLVKSPRFGTGVYLCGDYQTSATFDGALVSGRLAAEALLKDLAVDRAG